MTYAQRLQYLSIPSLELRRLHFDLLFCYKIVFGLVDIITCIFLISLNFVLLVAPEGMHINSSSHTVIVAYVANSLPKELSKFGIHCRLLLTLLHSPYLDSIMCVDFSAFLKFFLIFQFVSYCCLLYCLDTGRLVHFAKLTEMMK